MNVSSSKPSFGPVSERLALGVSLIYGSALSLGYVLRSRVLLTRRVLAEIPSSSSCDKPRSFRLGPLYALNGKYDDWILSGYRDMVMYPARGTHGIDYPI